MISFALTSSKWMLDLATRLVKADVRIRNIEAVKDDMAIVFVVNHFTRLETMLLPYMLYKHTGKTIWSLASAGLFKGRIGTYLRSMGAVSTQDPDRDKTIIRSLLEGQHPWIIFPEGAMIKDKKVIDHRGAFSVYNDGTRRPPHRGAAVLALLAEFYRRKLACLAENPDQALIDAVLQRFGLESIEQAIGKRTVIIPVNITYYPIRAHDNVILRAARAVLKGGLSPRAIEELSVEGTVLSEDTDIDIVLGEPIDIGAYLDEAHCADVMASGVEDIGTMEENPRSMFNDAARRLTHRYMDRIYRLTTVNPDHILATLLRQHKAGRFSERAFRNRLYLCTRRIERLDYRPVHSKLAATGLRALSNDPCPRFDNFMDLAVREGILKREGGYYVKLQPAQKGNRDFHSVRQAEITYVIANELEPVTVVANLVRGIAQWRKPRLLKTVRDMLMQDDLEQYEHDYRTFHDPELSKGPDVGRPFLLLPRWPKAGVVLVHGYMAAPLEVRALAEFLRAKRYAVYGVRLKGHGTAPADLGQTRWEAWYESVNQGYAILRTVTDRVFIGGFSMGAGLALMAAGRKDGKVQGAFAIDAPLYLRSYMVHLVPSLIGVNAFLKKIHWSKPSWEFVENQPENPHINYTRNPLYGMRQLGQAMDAMRTVLPEIEAPTLILQGANDPVVSLSSGQEIFNLVGTPLKRLTVLDRSRHGIVNGEGSAEVFETVNSFLERALRQTPTPRAAPEQPQPEPESIATEMP